MPIALTQPRRPGRHGGLGSRRMALWSLFLADRTTGKVSRCMSQSHSPRQPRAFGPLKGSMPVQFHNLHVDSIGFLALSRIFKLPVWQSNIHISYICCHMFVHHVVKFHWDKCQSDNRYRKGYLHTITLPQYVWTPNAKWVSC